MLINYGRLHKKIKCPACMIPCNHAKDIEVLMKDSYKQGVTDGIIGTISCTDGYKDKEYISDMIRRIEYFLGIRG